jgi:hypothetical protein
MKAAAKTRTSKPARRTPSAKVVALKATHRRSAKSSD